MSPENWWLEDACPIEIVPLSGYDNVSSGVDILDSPSIYIYICISIDVCVNMNMSLDSNYYNNDTIDVGLRWITDLPQHVSCCPVAHYIILHHPTTVALNSAISKQNSHQHTEKCHMMVPEYDVSITGPSNGSTGCFAKRRRAPPSFLQSQGPHWGPGCWGVKQQQVQMADLLVNQGRRTPAINKLDA